MAFLDRLDLPTLVVGSRTDPIIPAAGLERALSQAPQAQPVRGDAGGHIHFPATLDLGFRPRTGLEPQVMGWMKRDTGRSSRTTCGCAAGCRATG